MLIIKSRACSNLDALSPQSPEMTLAVASWAEVLEDVPSEHLNDCYKTAMKRHATSFPLSAGEIASVWPEIRAAIGRIPRCARCEDRQIVGTPTGPKECECFKREER